MITVEQISELIHNETQWSNDESPFFVLDSWDIYNHIEENLKLDFEICLYAIVNPDESYPVLKMDESEIKQLESDLINYKLTQAGQLALENFPEFKWTYDFNPDESEQLINLWNESEQDIEWFNDSLTILLSRYENWGFYDEWSFCSECYCILRTSPDSYSWTPEYIETDCGYICPECLDSDDLENEIQKTQDKIIAHDQPTSLRSIFEIPSEFIPVNPTYSFKNGLHRGQNDDPLRQGIETHKLKDKNGIRLLDIIFRVYPSQFTIEWDSYIRFNPESEHKGLNLETIAEQLNDIFENDCQFPYDIADLYSKALKNTPYNFTSIDVNPNTGDIKYTGSNDINEYIQGHNN